MKNFILAFRSLFKKGQGNIIKTLSLGVGLAVGLILIAKIYFEFNYDNFYPDHERVYQIQTNFKVNEDEAKTYGQVSGGIALGMKNDIPEVESATRLTYFSSTFFTETDQKINAEFYMTDSMFFDVLPRPMVLGNAADILSKPMYAIVSRSLAEKLAKNIHDVIGQAIEFEGFPGKIVTIGGIFEDIPENSHLRYDALLSLYSINNFWQWDGSENWLGNDRYRGYVKLFPGTDPNNLTQSILQMQERHQDLEELQKAGFFITYVLAPLDKLHSESPELRVLSIILALLAFAIIFTAVMNYILIVISSLVNRTKEVAIHKCYGATGKNITNIILSETFVHILLSLLLAAGLILIFKSTIEGIFGNSIKALFTFNSVLLLVIVCGFVFLFTGLIPSKIFSNIPVTSAFRNYKKSRRVWKLILLFFQFTAVSFLITLLAIMGLQYNLMIKDKPGYKYEDVLYYHTAGLSESEISKAMDALNSSSEVELVTIGDDLLLWTSGNNVYMPGDDKVQFNFGDLYCVDENFLTLFEIPVIEGVDFNINSIPSQMMVSRSFADKLSELQNWKDGVVGKDVFISEHGGPLKIIGVYEDIRVGSIEYNNSKPTAIFYKNEHFPPGIIFIKLKHLDQKKIQDVNDILKSVIPDKDVTVTPYKTTVISMYDSFKEFRNIIMIVGIITLIISLTGLAGYTRDEVNRRSSEIAIRKINGATIMNIQRLFVTDILKIALPSIIIGSIISVFVSNKWMENFVKKIDFSIWLFVICGIIILIIIIAVMIANTYIIAAKNPVESIKSE